MPFGGLLSLAAAGLSVGGGIAGLMKGSPASNVQIPQSPYTPYMGPAVSGAFTGIENLPGTNLPGQVLPQAQQTQQNLYNNPYAGVLQGGAATASDLGTTGAMNQFNSGNYLTGAGAGLIPGAATIMNTAFDPQSALYNRTLQQFTDQMNVGQAQRGIATTPYGAGLYDQGVSNFNIDWQNQQLQRQAQGAQAAGGLVQQGGQAISAGQTLANAAPGQYMQASTYPYSAYNTIGTGQMGSLESLLGIGSSSQALAQTPIQDYLSFLGQGQTAGAQDAQLGLNQAQLGFNQQQQLGANFGAGMQGLGNANWGWLNNLYGGQSSFGSPLAGSSPLGQGGIGSA